VEIPENALATPVSITAEPVAALGVVGAQGMILLPSGQTFSAPVTIRVRPPAPVPVGRQVVFTFADDGTSVWAAEPRMDTRDIVIVTNHFTGFGFADIASGVREKYVKWTTNRAADRISSEVDDALQTERQRQLLGDPADPNAMEAVTKAIDQYEEDVVKPRVANADTSCAAAKEAIATVLGLERARQLLGLPSGSADPNRVGSPDPIQETLAVGLKPCEKEAIAECQAARDPGILISFWTGANRQAALLGQPPPYSTSNMDDRAQAICAPLAYQIDGGLNDWKVSQRVCNIMERFTLTGTIGRMTFSGGLSGSDSFAGVFNAKYTGRYHFSFPNGRAKAGTMVNSSGGTIAGGYSGSGTEHYSVIPAGPAC
jgi:hypothetical protein